MALIVNGTELNSCGGSRVNYNSTPISSVYACDTVNNTCCLVWTQYPECFRLGTWGCAHICFHYGCVGPTCLEGYISAGGCGNDSATVMVDCYYNGPWLEMGLDNLCSCAGLETSGCIYSASGTGYCEASCEDPQIEFEYRNLCIYGYKGWVSHDASSTGNGELFEMIHYCKGYTSINMPDNAWGWFWNYREGNQFQVVYACIEYEERTRNPETGEWSEWTCTGLNTEGGYTGVYQLSFSGINSSYNGFACDFVYGLWHSGVVCWQVCFWLPNDPNYKWIGCQRQTQNSDWTWLYKSNSYGD